MKKIYLSNKNHFGQVSKIISESTPKSRKDNLVDNIFAQ